ncbi:MAG: FecR domain-containing protein [Anaerolineae bacterium]
MNRQSSHLSPSRRLIELLTAVLVAVLIAGCAMTPTATSQSPVPLANVTGTPTGQPIVQLIIVEGKVSLFQPGAGEPEPSMAVYEIRARARISTDRDSSAIIAFVDGTKILIGSSTQITLSSVSYAGVGINASLQLDIGRVLVVLEGESITITTPVGSAQVEGSIMGVVVAPTGITNISCFEGHCQASSNGGALSLQAQEGGVIYSPLGAPGSSPIDWKLVDPYAPIPEPTRGFLFQTATAFAIIMDATETAWAQPSATPTPTMVRSATPTFPATSTPEPTSTEGGEPTPRPIAIETPGADGLTEAERAHSGTHEYDFACQSFNRCVCSEAVNSMSFRFDSQAVTLSAEGYSVQYKRIGPSVYQLAGDTMVATLRFYLDSWVLTFTRPDGSLCVIQTLTLR